MCVQYVWWVEFSVSVIECMVECVCVVGEREV